MTNRGLSGDETGEYNNVIISCKGYTLSALRNSVLEPRDLTKTLQHSMKTKDGFTKAGVNGGETGNSAKSLNDDYLADIPCEIETAN
jgi:hypothetical protein